MLPFQRILLRRKHHPTITSECLQYQRILLLNHQLAAPLAPPLPQRERGDAPLHAVNEAEADARTQRHGVIGNTNALPLADVIFNDQNHQPASGQHSAGMAVDRLHGLPVACATPVADLSWMAAVIKAERAVSTGSLVLQMPLPTLSEYARLRQRARPVSGDAMIVARITAIEKSDAGTACFSWQRKRPFSFPFANYHSIWYIIHMQRTIIIQLEPSSTQALLLADVYHQFTDVFNAVAAYGWQQREKNGVKLHHALYYPLREQYPTLISDLHVQARVKATEAVKSALALQKAGRTVHQPHANACPPRYNQNSYKVDWESRTVRLSTTTTAGRQTIRFTLPAYAEKYAGCATDTADLMQRDGRWFLHIVVTVPTPDVLPNDLVVGVDLGLNRPAVTSLNRFYGKKVWKALEHRRFRHMRALQAKGTKSAKRRLQSIRHTRARFRRDCDHVLSKQIVQSTPEGGTIAVENLTNIRTRAKQRGREQRRRMHSWSFAQLRAFLTYKAEERGCTVVGVDPRHTSQQCSRCGHTARNNRRSQAVFVCRNCGLHLNADLNAARNIAAKYRASIGKPDTGGLLSISLSSQPSG